MKRNLTPDVVATTMGLALALVILSVPLASANVVAARSGTSNAAHVATASDKDESSDDLGEASYNTEDCEPATEGDKADGGVESKDLSECRKDSE